MSEFMSYDPWRGVTTRNGIPGDLVISEIHYRPAKPSEEEVTAGFDSRSAFEFVEIYNASDFGSKYQKIKRDSINSLLFYPEGGQIVESIPVQIGFIGVL